MGFYNELSKYYDIIFPVTEDKINFIHDRSTPNSNILDLACGTGGYAIALSKLGHNLSGIDLDEEMIRIANKKVADEGLRIDFRQGDMLDISSIFDKKKFDIIFCIGNSLVHLDSENEIEQLFQDVYRMLNDEGKMIIQIVNYDRILDNNINFLPTIERKEEGVNFIRKYECDKDNNKINFLTELLIQKDKYLDEYINSVPLIPLRSDALISMVEKVGFSKTELFGSFKEDVYTSESFPTIAVVYK